MKILIDNFSALYQDNLCEKMHEYFKSKNKNSYLMHTKSNKLPFHMNKIQPDWYITSSIMLKDEMFWNYVENDSRDMLYIVMLHETCPSSTMNEIEDNFKKNKKRYKIVGNNNFGSGYAIKYEENFINFPSFQTDLLITTEEIKWKKEFDFLLIGEHNRVDVEDLGELRENFSFHTQILGSTSCAEYVGPLSLDANVLCNYKSFVFYSNERRGLGKTFYDICALRKPVYILYGSTPKNTKKSLGMEIDISFDNIGKDNINFKDFHDHIAKEFSVENQMNKLFTHLPKPKKSQ